MLSVFKNEHDFLPAFGEILMPLNLQISFVTKKSSSSFLSDSSIVTDKRFVESPDMISRNKLLITRLDFQIDSLLLRCPLSTNDTDEITW